MKKVLTFVLAGGRGERLNPLTKDRAKPAVPFGGIYRIIDYTLSNCINSGLRNIYVLTQYKSFSLQKHILSGWNFLSNQLGEFIDVIPAQQRVGSDWYKGTADAIHQNKYAIQDCQPSLILILAGDHIYKMNYGKMILVHHEKIADVTVACVPMPVETAQSFGVIEVDENGFVTGFQEKPKNPKTIPGDPTKILASMGIYLFNKDILLNELDLDAKQKFSDHDFGKNIIPSMLKRNKKVCVYNFVDDKNKTAYWRDIGTRDAYYQANMDLVKEKDSFNLYDKEWPVRTFQEQYPPIKLMSSGNKKGSVVDSLLSGGCVIEGATLENAVLSPNVIVKKDADIRDSVIMESVVIGKRCKIRNAIIDKEVDIPDDYTIGYDEKEDAKRFVITKSGVIIVAKKSLIDIQVEN